MDYFAGWCLLLAYVGFGVSRFRRAVASLTASMDDATVLLLLVPYLLAVSFRPPLMDLLRWTAYLMVPTSLLRAQRRGLLPLGLARALAILAIWVPLEPDLFLLFVNLALPGVSLPPSLGRLFLLPEAYGMLVPGVRMPLGGLTAVVLALYLFGIRYPVEALNVVWRLKVRDLVAGVVGWGGYALVAVPVGLAIGFLQPAPRRLDPMELLLGVVGGFLMVALVEEVLFRGLIQNLLTQRLRSRALGLGLAALVFGLAHLNNATPGFSVPNWAYVFMASMAGLTYGAVWLYTGKVTASALTHMLVNLMWGLVFR